VRQTTKRGALQLVKGQQFLLTRLELVTKRLALTPNNDDTDEEIERDLEHIPENVPPIKPATPKEIKKAINRLNPKKAPGMDKITPTMVKKLTKKESYS
jgi:hypothetical protein